MPVGEARGISRRTALAGLIALTAAACSRLAFLAANLPAAFGAYERRADIAYGADPQHRLDVYIPDSPPIAAHLAASDESPAVARPLIVFWHGGRWSRGDKGDYRFVGAALARLGYTAVLANYRHYDQVKMAGFMDDAAQAALFAVAHARDFGADPQRLFLMGHSAGAHMAALLALDRRIFASTGQTVPHIAGMIGLSGAYDFLPLLEPDLQDMFGPPDHYAASQPVNFVRPDAAPMLLVHGLKDETVLPKNSRNLAAALIANHVPVTLRLYPKLAHADTVAALSTPARSRAPILADIAAFVGAQARG